MSELDLIKVDRFVRAVVDGRIVVCRPGDRIDRELALRLGVIERPRTRASAGVTGPRKPAGARAAKRSA